MINIYPVIIAGGSGTRFWPLSRSAKPKQFLEFGNGEQSLIQATAKRMEAISQRAPIIVTSSKHQDLCLEHVPNAVILPEPLAKNTAAAVAYAAAIIQKQDPSGVMLVTWSDAAIGNEQEFLSLIEAAAEYVSVNQKLALIGVRPESPHTGYGYIETISKDGDVCFEVKRFIEKPDLVNAQLYCESGKHFWNPGIFVWKASDILKSFQKYLPEISEAVPSLQSSFGTNKQAEAVLDFFTKAPSISIDHGILEKEASLVLFPANNLRWSDIGSWDVWADFHSKDVDGNTVQAESVMLNAKNNLVYSNVPKKILALYGVEDLVIVDTEDALLICPKKDCQQVKQLVEMIKKKGKESCL